MNDVPHTSANITGLGAMLRQARESAGLSQAELARQLNLGTRIVEAMEQEDVSALPGAVYVHGYLRKWADYLRLDEKRLQQAYTQLAGEQRPNGMRHTTTIEPMRMKRNESGFPWFKMLFILIFLGLGLFATRFLPESMRLIESMPEAPSNTISDLPVSPPALPSIPLQPPSEAKPSAPVIATTPGVIVGEVVTTSESIGKMPPPVATATQPPATSVAKIKGLELKGQGNAQGSWVRVKDADAGVIFEGILAPGNSKQLDGKRPFEITIGRASDLAITLDGIQIDLTAYARPGGKAFIPKLGDVPNQ